MEIPRYTKELIIPRQVENRVNPQAIEDAAIPYKVVSDISSDIKQKIDEEQRVKMNRYDTIQSARLSSNYKNEIDGEFVKFSQEQDLVDPNSIKDFRSIVEGKTGEYLSKFDGSADARDKLEIELLALQDTYMANMRTKSDNAQTEFILGAWGSELDRIASEVSSNPNNLDVAFQQIEGLGIKYENAMYPEDEYRLKKNAKSVIVESALKTYIDSGRLDAADALYSDFSKKELLSPEKQRQYGEVIYKAQAVKAEALGKQSIRRDHINQIESAGIELDPLTTMRYIQTGDVDLQKSKRQLLKDYADDTHRSIEQIPMEEQLAITNPTAATAMREIKGDPNKRFGPDGKLNEAGVVSEIAPPMERIRLLRTKLLGLKTAVEEFRSSKSGVAVQTAITTFKQTFEPNSAVMEGEVRMIAETRGLSDRLETFINMGQGIGAEQVEEMWRMADNFVKEASAAEKAKVDPTLEYAISKGMHRVSIGASSEQYFEAFGTEELGKAKTIKDYSVEELIEMRNKARSSGG